MIIALVLAGGGSTRMGRPKLLLPMGSHTVLGHAIDGLRAAGVDRIIVAAAPAVPALEEVARSHGAEAFTLAHPTTSMRETVEAGLGWIEQHWSPRPDDFWLLMPGDHPLADPAVVSTLVAEAIRQDRYSIFIPVQGDRRGHPALIRWRHVPAIRAWPAESGLNEYFRACPSATLEVEVDSPTIHWDLDTPEDYDRLRGLVTPQSAGNAALTP